MPTLGRDLGERDLAPRATRSGGASRPAASGGCSGSMWVSTSTSGPSSSRSAASSSSAISWAAPSASLRSTSRSSETESLAADVVHGDVMHRERLVARDHHDALLHGLVVERARRRSSTLTSARGISARIASATVVLERLDAVERQRAADRHDDLDEQLVADRPHAHAVDRDHAADPRGDARGCVSATPAGAVSVSVSMVRRPSRQPARQTNSATTIAAAESAQWIAERDAAEPDQHRDRRPHVGAEMQRIGLQRLARGFAGDAVEQARAEEIDHDRDDDHGEGRDRRLDRMAVLAEQPLAPPPRSPRRTARTAAPSRPAPRRSRPCRGRSDAPRRPACRRCARRNRSSPSRRGRSANARPPTGSRASRSSTPTTPLASVRPPEATIEPSATCSFSCCIGTLEAATAAIAAPCR